MSEINNTLEEIAERIKRAKSAVILTHMRPDGDAIGSALALSRALDVLGIENSVSDESDIPSNLSFLTGTEKIGKGFFKEADLYIAVDSADEQRLGALVDDFRAVSRKKDTVNIDHHVSNTRFAKYNYVRECSANCMNIAALVEKLGVPLDKELAQYLLLGLLTDSGNFSHDDVTEETFLTAAKLVKAGADIRWLNYNLFKKQSAVRAALFADTMSRIRYFFEGKFAAIVISREAMKKFGADNGHDGRICRFPPFRGYGGGLRFRHGSEKGTV